MLVWSTPTPFVHADVGGLRDHPWKQSYYDRLGMHTFRGEHLVEGAAGEHVPTFAEHRAQLSATRRRGSA